MQGTFHTVSTVFSIKAGVFAVASVGVMCRKFTISEMTWTIWRFMLVRWTSRVTRRVLPNSGTSLSHQQVSSSSGRLRKRQRGLLRQFAEEASCSILKESRHGVPRRNPLLEFKFSDLCLDALLGRLSGIGDRRIFAQMFLQDRTTTEVPGMKRRSEVQGTKHSCRPHEVCRLRWFGS